MEEENKSTRCHRPRTYREDFKKSVVEDYEARIGEYASTSAYAREKGIPDNPPVRLAEEIRKQAAFRRT